MLINCQIICPAVIFAHVRRDYTQPQLFTYSKKSFKTAVAFFEILLKCAILASLVLDSITFTIWINSCKVCALSKFLKNSTVVLINWWLSHIVMLPNGSHHSGLHFILESLFSKNFH